MNDSSVSARFVTMLGPVYGNEQETGNSDLSSGGDNYSANSKYEPIYASVVSNGEVGECRIVGARLPEDFDGDITLGQAVQVKDTQPADGGPSIVFNGVVVKKHITIGGQSTTAEMVVYNLADDYLRRATLHGQWRRDHEKEMDYWNNGPQSGSPIEVEFNDSVVLIDTPLTFNPDGQPNRTQDTYFTTADSNDPGSDQSDDFYIFEAPFRNQTNANGKNLLAQYWKLSDAIVYLLNTTTSDWAIDPGSYATQTIVQALPTNPVVSNVSCEGKSLAQALSDLLCPHNYGYWVSSDVADGNNPQHTIHFFARDDDNDTDAKTLKLATRGTNANASDANLVQLDITMDASATVNRVEAYGDRISYTTLLHTNPPSTTPSCPTLVRGWKASDLVFAYEGDNSTVNTFDITFRQNYCNPTLITPPTGSGGKGIYGVGRMWLVNQGEVPSDALEDLSDDLTVSGDSTVTGDNSVDPRRLERPELYDQNTAGGLLHQEDVVVEMTFDGGSNWNIVDKSVYRVLPEGMGIVLVDPSLEQLGLFFKTSDPNWTNGTMYWQALSDSGASGSKLQVRILCAIRSDERVNKIVANDGSAYPLATSAVFNNQGYKRTVYNSAINSAVYFTKYPPAKVTQDDSSNLADLVKAQLKATNRVMVSGRAEVLLGDWGEYTPGMAISGIDNRDITFPNNPTVVRTIYKFTEQQVEVVLDNHRVQSVLKAKTINNAETRRQHKLGVENVSPMTGGQQVPYLPGDLASYEQFLRQGGGQ